MAYLSIRFSALKTDVKAAETQGEARGSAKIARNFNVAGVTNAQARATTGLTNADLEKI
jgi:hypothetical protein